MLRGAADRTSSVGLECQSHDPFRSASATHGDRHVLPAFVHVGHWIGVDPGRCHRYHGVLAPNAGLRYQVIAFGREQGTAQESSSGQLGAQSVAGSSDGTAPRRTSSRWAALIARIYDVLPLVRPSCGVSMSIIAFITDPVPLHAILSHLDLPTRPPPLSPARAPPQGLFAFDQTGGFDPTDPEAIPEFEFDQSLPD